jgi:hypothetical protein
VSEQAALWALYDRLTGEIERARETSEELTSDEARCEHSFYAGKRIGLEDAQYFLSKLLEERPEGSAR